MTPIRGVISDFGGVLTTPLLRSFAAFQDRSGIPLEVLAQAMARVEREDGRNPLHVLERGEVSEADFMTRVARALTAELGRPVEMHGFADDYWAHLEPNPPLVDRLRELRGAGLRLAMLTNNVREWEPRWRAMLPVDELFDVIVDSAFVGMRKPEPEIYELTLEKLGLPAAACVFIDDLDVNCEAAAALGMHVVHFRETGQALAELDALVSGGPPGS